MSSRIAMVGLVGLVAGCSYNEGITIRDLTGKVILPEEAGTRTFFYADGTEETISDPRLIGPVYLGLYSGVAQGGHAYPHPVQGPAVVEGKEGDTYPYGGTSIGDFRFPCLQYLQCKVTSGRFVTFDHMVEWFNETLELPITDAYGDTVESGDYIAQTCFDLLDYATEEEIRLTVTEDKNEDGALDELDLDFVQQDDGTFVAEFIIRQQEYFENEESGQGFSLWGWMDAPDENSNLFTTCDSSGGFLESEYAANFYGGRPQRDLLNFPATYITSGDWVASEAYVYSSPDDENVEITLGLQVEVE